MASSFCLWQVASMGKDSYNTYFSLLFSKENFLLNPGTLTILTVEGELSYAPTRTTSRKAAMNSPEKSSQDSLGAKDGPCLKG